MSGKVTNSAGTYGTRTGQSGQDGLGYGTTDRRMKSHEYTEGDARKEGYIQQGVTKQEATFSLKG